jgi:hypothetical protein
MNNNRFSLILLTVLAVALFPVQWVDLRPATLNAFWPVAGLLSLLFGRDPSTLFLGVALNTDVAISLIVFLHCLNAAYLCAVLLCAVIAVTLKQYSTATTSDAGRSVIGELAVVGLFHLAFFHGVACLTILNTGLTTVNMSEFVILMHYYVTQYLLTPFGVLSHYRPGRMMG